MSVSEGFEPDSWYTQVTRGQIARRLVEVMLRRVPVAMRLPDGRRFGAAGEVPTIDLIRPEALFRRLESHPKIGLGEAYMAGDWRPAAGSDLAEVMVPFAARMSRILPKPLMGMRLLVDRALPDRHRNDIAGSRANIAAHYDLSNEMFETFLDPSMTYSSALFDEARPFAEQDLLEAQHRKIDAALDRAGVVAGTRVLEIGTGWGELALRAAQRGAQVTSITLSERQREYALAKVAAAGLADRVDIELCDYRQVTGEYDAIVSIEMIEAVGEEFWPAYFTAIDHLLAPGGTCVIQAILMDHERLLVTRNSFGWIQKYIFPGGIIPSLQAINEVLAEHTTLTTISADHFGLHYAHTLGRWRQRFLAASDQVAALGFDDTFRRMWEFYLAYCEAGFASGYLDVAQVRVGRSVADSQASL